MSPKDQRETRSYLLRVWEERGATPPWRFTLVYLGSKRQQGFGSWAALVAFLEKEVDALDSAQTARKPEDES